ncbi:MAG TPA: CoA pyrophosphatase [Bacteroidales bacterium]|nr:CoA pyrophosphatase [Bacteroidales bacterium]
MNSKIQEYFGEYLMITQLNKNKLEQLIQKSLPGEKAQSEMAPVTRNYTYPMPRKKSAAVMLLLYPDQNETRIVFIKRNEYRGPHSGQVSFPGGMFENVDNDLKQTAIRETEEEIGISAEKIDILGALTPLSIPVSNTFVQPFVGWLDRVPVFYPEKSEVQYLIITSLKDLFDPANCKKGTFGHTEQPIDAPYFEIEGEIIWGATAMMLGEFRALVDL